MAVEKCSRGVSHNRGRRETCMAAADGAGVKRQAGKRGEERAEETRDEGRRVRRVYSC